MGLGTRLVYSIGHWLWHYPEEGEVAEARKPYREAIHGSRNIMMIASHSARKSKLANDRATEAAEEAINELRKVTRCNINPD